MSISVISLTIMKIVSGLPTPQDLARNAADLSRARIKRAT